jgi:hypothetical protein
MSRPTSPAYKTWNWPSDNEALKRRGSLTIWFDPAMTWEAAPTGKRGRQPDYSDAAIQTFLSMKVLFGMALRQTTGFVESLLRLIGLDWAVPDFSTLSRRQKTLKVNIPYRGSEGPLHLLVDIEPVSATGSSEPARGHQGRGRRGVERAQARRLQAPLATASRTGGETAARLAQDPHRDRRANTGDPGGRVHHQ